MRTNFLTFLYIVLYTVIKGFPPANKQPKPLMLKIEALYPDLIQLLTFTNYALILFKALCLLPCTVCGFIDHASLPNRVPCE